MSVPDQISRFRKNQVGRELDERRKVLRQSSSFSTFKLMPTSMMVVDTNHSSRQFMRAMLIPYDNSNSSLRWRRYHDAILR